MLEVEFYKDFAPNGAKPLESARTSFPLRLDLSTARPKFPQLLRQSADRLFLRECDEGFRRRQTPWSSSARWRLYSCLYRSSWASRSSRARLCLQDTRAAPARAKATPLCSRNTFPPAADRLWRKPWLRSRSFLHRAGSLPAPER